MRVTFEQDRDHQRIFDDEDFVFVLEQAERSKLMQQFIAAAIRRYQTRDEVRRGKRGGDRNMEGEANSYFKDKRSRQNGVAVAHRFARLFDVHDAGNVRGALIEAMVEGRLRARYGHGQLNNNVNVALSNGVEYRTSTSVDVAGHDGELGECHDCKAKGSNVDIAWIRELVVNLGPHRFRIGVATAESAPAAAQAMRSRGGGIPQGVTITGPELWWDNLPLWRG
ncbi:MAG TPA: hypothetical protein VGG08_08445 [Solirubrobacteraceae bacterium]|jgi:hypothetical protein